MNKMAQLRAAIDKHAHLEIDDETSTKDGFSVIVRDRRNGTLGVWIATIDQLNDLVAMGAEWYLDSVHNGGILRRS